MIIGREKEIERLREAYESDYSEFVAVYGRRRVGKTFLVREAFNYQFTFQHAGLANSNMKQQLAAWRLSLKDAGLEKVNVPRNWLDAFDLLKALIKQSADKKKVVFIDEMPWMDTKRSEFISALEHFWNCWASARKDVLLIICGSSTSWIINKVIKNHGGLHNRVTYQLHLKQFTLAECYTYASANKLGMTQRQVLECYMVLGGVPFYWSFLDRRLGLAQNIDRLFFSDDAPLKDEYHNLYSSLFREPEPYIKVVSTLGKKKCGMTREELVGAAGLQESGKLTRILEDLQYCGFIRKYHMLGKKVKGSVFQLTDFYTLFYFRFMHYNAQSDSKFWSRSVGTPIYNVWCGLAFERVCLMHVEQIKDALSIGGVMSSEASWYSSPSADATSVAKGAQIDLLIDRNDDVIDVCEMKYYAGEYVVSEDEERKIENRILRLREETSTKKAIHAILVTTEGLKHNPHAAVFQSVVVMKDLFRE
ncbi:MAG: ATP-binding protein [Bacteroidales bacterium]|nr:ATP-binding protein [Bacteroidales bacterium]